MTFILLSAIGSAIVQFLLAIIAVFLILLVLVQRGRGGGLAGALGGMGGSSAFGAKAGDVFTRVTIVAAAIWIALCLLAAHMGPGSDESPLSTTGIGASAPPANSGPALSAPAGKEGDQEADAGAEKAKVDAIFEEESAVEQPADVPATDEDSTSAADDSAVEESP